MPNPRLIPQVSPTNKVSWGIGGVFGKSQELGTIRPNLSKLVHFTNRIKVKNLETLKNPCSWDLPKPRLIPQVSPTNKVFWGIGGVFGKSQEHGTIRANLSKLVHFINKIHDFPELTHSACLYCTRAGSHSFDMRTKIPWGILSYTCSYFMVNFGTIWKFCLKVPLRSLWTDMHCHPLQS